MQGAFQELMISPREQAAAYCKDIQKVEGYQAWIIGIVEKGNRSGIFLAATSLFSSQCCSFQDGEDH